MELTRYVADLQHRIASAAELGGDDARQLATRLTAPIDAAVRLVLIDALSVAAGEISTELAPGSVDVRVRGGEPEFVVTLPTPSEPVKPAAQAAPAAPVAPSSADDESSTTRTTLRLPDHLKSQAEAAAARDGVSVNTWLVRAVAAALTQPTTERPAKNQGDRITGWVR